jgi:hypothetical protein
MEGPMVWFEGWRSGARRVRWKSRGLGGVSVARRRRTRTRGCTNAVGCASSATGNSITTTGENANCAVRRTIVGKASKVRAAMAWR